MRRYRYHWKEGGWGAGLVLRDRFAFPPYLKVSALDSMGSRGVNFLVMLLILIYARSRYLL